MFFGLWAWWILCAPDTLAWNVAFMIGNYAHAIYLFIKVKRPRKFSKDCEAVYERLFEQYGVKRFQFEQLAKKCSVLELNQGDVYGKVGMPAERISVLIQGRSVCMEGPKAQFIFEIEADHQQHFIFIWYVSAACDG